MLDQLLNLVRQYGKETVENNPEVPNEHNNDVMAEATKTIGSGFQNILSGGGFQNILDLFKMGGNSSGKGGLGGLIRNPIVTMMVGHFISKLVSKFKMSSSAASNVSNGLIPNVLNDLITRTKSNDPENDAFDFNDLIGSLSGGNMPTSESGAGGFNFQDLLNKVTGGGNPGQEGNGFDLQDVIRQVTQGTQQNQEQQSGSGGGLMGMIKGFFTR